MTSYYESGCISGVLKFVEYLKENSCFYDLDNYHSFSAVDMDDLEDLAKEFLDKKEYI